jgi:hypothetical protein
MADNVLLSVNRLELWFAERFQGLRTWHSNEVVAYVTGVFGNRRLAQNDLSTASVTLAYESARAKRDFAELQRVGDWVLWVEAMCPDSLGHNHDIVENFGRLSYYACHDIMRGQWHVYAELANDLPVIAKHVQHHLV